MVIFSDAEKAYLAAAASWPAERHLPRFEPEPNPAAIVGYMAQWRQHVAKGDPEVFSRVLRWRGVDPSQEAARLAPVRLAQGAPLPEWIAELCALLTAAVHAPGMGKPDWLDLAAPNSKEALLAPLVTSASRLALARLRAQGGDAGALAPLQRELLRTLVRLAGDALADFVGEAEPLRQALLAYPVLARLLARFCANWAAAATEMLDRLAADRAALTAFLGADPGPPLLCETTDADAHDGGRMVVLLSFAGNLRIAYKPRDLRLDLGFAALLEDLCARGLDLAGAVPRCLVRPGYGWVEFIRHRHAADAAELTRFWHRAGQLLGVLTALGGVDMHGGNVIAAGDRLVLIDLETVLSPPLIEAPPLPADGEGAVPRLGRLLLQTPLLTAMLPLLVRQEGGRVAHFGAFGAMGEPGASHRATAGPIEAELLKHHADLDAGFALAVQVLRAAAPALIAPGGALAALAPGAVRHLFRDTRVYLRLLHGAFRPDCLTDGAAWDVELEQLARMLAPFAAPPRFVAIVAAEKRALAELDIPRFDLAADGTALRDRHGVVVPAMASQSPLGHARQRLAGLASTDEAFLRREVGMALQLRLLGHAAEEAGPLRVRPAAALAGALAIARRLRGKAVEGHDGSLTWHCPRHDVRLGAMELLGFNFGLADGTLGIALFLAALADLHTTPETLAWREGSLAALRPSNLPAAHTSLAAPLSGLLEGLGGEAWGYAALARLGAPEWCAEMARAQAERLLALPLGGDASLATGMAGGVLAALAVHRLDPACLPITALAPLVQSLAAASVTDGGLMTGRAGIALALRRARGFGLAVDAAELPPANAAPMAGGWGRGALGIALARGEPPDLAMAQAAAAAGDGLWRGRAGLLMALDATGQAGAAVLAGDLAGLACADALRPVLPRLPGVVMPGLSNGLAGIGYALLCHVRPTLPNVALFD